MSQDFRSILKTLEFQNKQFLEFFYKISFMLGINLKYKSNYKNPRTLVSVCLVSVSLLGLCAQYCLVLHNLKESFVKSAEALCTSNQVSISILKLIYLVFVQQNIYVLLQSATDSAILHELEVMDLAINCKQQLLQDIKGILAASWSNIKHQLIFYCFLCLLVCGFYMFWCIFANYYFAYIQPQNVTLQLPMPALFPMWHDYGMTLPYYPIQYIITATENYICGMNAVCFDGSFIIVVVHCAALFEILHKLLEYAANNEIPQTERVKYLICCVQLHERIYRYYGKINALYRHPSLAQCIWSMLVLCVVMFTANVGLEEDITLFFKMMFFLCAAGYQISLYCYNGQQIITLSEKSPSIWLNCAWYNESKHFRYIINMMILRSNRTMYLQVSGFATMSNITLLSILQTSGSYFLLLKNLNGTD